MKKKLLPPRVPPVRGSLQENDRKALIHMQKLQLPISPRASLGLPANLRINPMHQTMRSRDSLD